MQMTKGDIIKLYKEAKEKKKQIEILSQLNACSPADIRQILIEGGVQFPGPKPKKTEEKAEAPKEPKESKIPEEVINAISEYLSANEMKIKAFEAEIIDLKHKITVVRKWFEERL